MPWIYALVGVLVGAVIGFAISRFTAPDYKKQKKLYKDLETAKFELEQQKQELTDHFAQSAEMLDSLGKEYTKLYQHMAKTSSELLPNIPEQDNPFAQKVAQQKNASSADQSLEDAPKDYANGATGLLREEKKEYVDAPEQSEEKKAS
ncbi:Z-ring associated protein ZapG [Vibrio fluminensis]|uniref:Z-ring associated protein ZapG n=1 Tax=Vibrio fluminensis TaxID=2783614 RepID=UPI001889540B|nr:Z-ring associated protein ZapG [Vibrio fluminensis]